MGLRNADLAYPESAAALDALIEERIEGELRVRATGAPAALRCLSSVHADSRAALPVAGVRLACQAVMLWAALVASAQTRHCLEAKWEAHSRRSAPPGYHESCCLTAAALLRQAWYNTQPVVAWWYRARVCTKLQQVPSKVVLADARAPAACSQTMDGARALIGHTA